MQLVSAEGFEFYIDRRCAMVSGIMRRMLEGTAFVGTHCRGAACTKPLLTVKGAATRAAAGQFIEAQNNEISFRDIRCAVTHTPGCIHARALTRDGAAAQFRFAVQCAGAGKGLRVPVLLPKVVEPVRRQPGNTQV